MLRLKYLFENYELAKEILQNWNYDDDGLDDLLQQFRISSNAIYPYSWKDEIYFLRLSPIEEKKIKNLQAELQLLEFLQSQSFPALRAVPDKNGNKLLAVATKWGTYYACVFKRVEGNSVEDCLSTENISNDSDTTGITQKDISKDYHIIEKYGSALGELHCLSEQCPKLTTDSYAEVLNEIERRLKKYKAPEYMLIECQKVRNELSKLEKRTDNYGIIHYDFEPDNVFYDEKADRCDVIDFEDMMYHFFAMDIIKALDSINDEFGIQNYKVYEEAFLKGYTSKHAISKDMYESMQLMRRFERLYSYAGNIRAMADHIDDEPDWMQNIRTKLDDINRQIEYEILKDFDGMLIGKICEVKRDLFKITFEGKELSAKLKGSFYIESEEPPVVGDYVKFKYNASGDSKITSICERKSLLKRPDQSGHAIQYVKTMKEQVMVANFDYVFIVVSLNDNYNLNRIARYVSITLEGGGIPVVILTKSDLCDNVDKYVSEVKKLSDEVHVHAISSVSGQGLDELSEYMRDGITIALLGSSGVGKSTLVNALAGAEIMETGAIREKDSKGRHTTTSRELITLPNGVVLIDTPGMRELGMCDVKKGIDDFFTDITDLIGQCKFNDCTHTKEPKCAIKEALEDGRLSQERWQLYKSLQGESKRSADMKAISKQRKIINKKKH